jgi:sarcosine oxidase delta subunit
MENLLYRQAPCPYCGETIEFTLDGSAGGQDYVEDCSVCCRPIEVSLFHDGSEWQFVVRRDDE